jgi:type II secretory ATPase GspE/PulE/Tfp pilus assembly ATPase PilB-like protein
MGASPEKALELQKELTTLTKVDGALQKLFKQEIATGEILNIVLAGGLTNRASDIHFETAQGGAARLRYRIDGELQTVTKGISKDIYHLILLRIKLLCNLRLNVSNISQDGRFSIALGDLQIELRVAIAPSEFGEAIVMRILDPRAINITLPQLGLRPDDLAIVAEALKMPNGMVLNTGPTAGEARHDPREEDGGRPILLVAHERPHRIEEAGTARGARARRGHRPRRTTVRRIQCALDPAMDDAQRSARRDRVIST